MLLASINEAVLTIVGLATLQQHAVDVPADPGCLEPGPKQFRHFVGAGRA